LERQDARPAEHFGRCIDTSIGRRSRTIADGDDTQATYLHRYESNGQDVLPGSMVLLRRSLDEFPVIVLGWFSR
jgi:hypothetical protein